MDEISTFVSAIDGSGENESFVESTCSKAVSSGSEISPTPSKRTFRRIKRGPLQVPGSPSVSGAHEEIATSIPLSHTLSTTSTTDDPLLSEAMLCSETKCNSNSSLDSESITSSPSSASVVTPGLAAILHCLDFSATMTSRLVETFTACDLGNQSDKNDRKREIEGLISKGRTSIIRSYTSERIKDLLSKSCEEWKKRRELTSTEAQLLSADEAESESSETSAESVENENESSGRCQSPPINDVEEIAIPGAFQSSSNSSQSYPEPATSVSITEPLNPPELKDYQLVGVQWLLTLHEHERYGVLADEMGLGKTAQTISFLSILYSTGEMSKTSVIFCPATLLDNWMNEFGKFAPHLRVMKYHGDLKCRRKLIRKFEMAKNRGIPYHVLVGSAQAIGSCWDKSLFFKKHQFGYLIVDEAHSLKNSESQIYRNLKRSLASDRRLLLTGSPIQNDLGELQNLLAILLPRGLESSILSLAVESYGAHRGEISLQGADVARSRHVDEEGTKTSEKPSLKRDPEYSHQVEFLQSVFAPFILRRLKTEVMQDLPPKTTIIERCVIDGRQRELYVKAIADVDTELAKELSAFSLPAKLTESDDCAMQESSDFNRGQQSDDNLKAAEVTHADSANSKKRGVFESDKRSRMGTSSPSQRQLLKLKPKSKQFIQNLTFRLRRICNHPLLLRGFYTDKEIQVVINYYHKNVEGFKGQPYERVADEIESWSDYEIHQALGDLDEQVSLRSFRIPRERLLESAKIRRMLEIVQTVKTHGSKALVFSQFTTFLDVIEETLTLFTPELIFLRLDGATVISERQAMVDRFATDPDVTLFLLSTKAGGVGLNLTAADTVLLMDQGWNPHCERQAEDRVHRLGQTRPVIIHRLCCKDTLEETILRCAQRKLFLDEAFGGKSDLLSAAVLKDCLSSELARNGIDELRKREIVETASDGSCKLSNKPQVDGTTTAVPGRQKTPKVRTTAVSKRSRVTDVENSEIQQLEPKRSKKVRREDAPIRCTVEPDSGARSKVTNIKGSRKGDSKRQGKTCITKRPPEATTRNALLNRFSKVKPAATIR